MINRRNNLKEIPEQVDSLAKKYEELGIPYRLFGVPAMDPKRIPEIRKQILIARALERKRLGL